MKYDTSTLRVLNFKAFVLRKWNAIDAKTQHNTELGYIETEGFYFPYILDTETGEILYDFQDSKFTPRTQTMFVTWAFH